MFKVVYWPLPGRAHIVRAMLHYHEIEFEDVHANKETWPAEKEALKEKMLYPNLPHIVDGDLYISESLAIAKHTARKCGCVLTDTKELAIQDQFEGFCTDLMTKFSMARYAPEGETRDNALAAWKAGFADSLAPIEKFMGDGRKWVAGDNLCWIDFQLHYLFVQCGVAVDDLKEKCPNLNKHTDRLLEKESYKKFFDGINFKVFPFDF
jgi:glutathione S-transferase